VSAVTPIDRRFLFSPAVDLLAFGGSALVSLILLVVVVASGGADLALSLAPHLRHDEAPAPEWVWLSTVLLIDVAHVWGSAVLVYFDGSERRRRPFLYAAVPLSAFALSWALSSENEAWFWRALAYVAVFHFIRQQVGFVKLYRAKAADTGVFGRVVDEGAAYAATVAPVVWWHAQLPQPFVWFVEGDFVAGVPEAVGGAALVVEGVFLLLWLGRAVWLYRRGRGAPGKDLVIATTALLWATGIVIFSADAAFTLTNVIAHGVPYVVLVLWTAQQRKRQGLSLARVARHGAVVIVATLWALAFVEELLWDRLLWHERDWLYGFVPFFDVGELRPLFLALLALPQLTHYVLDAFVWKRRDNPTLT
jgi:hypothetical protein